MRFNRSLLLALAVAIAFCTVMPDITRAWTHGSGSSVLFSQRNVLNVNFVSNYDYAFINMIYQGDANSIGPIGSSFSATTSTFMQLVDANGWPNAAGASGHSFGGSTPMPSSANFSGPYVVTWTGSGTLAWSGVSGVGGTCTETNPNTTWTRNSNCNWTNKAGQSAYIVMNVTGLANQQKSGFQFTATGGADGFAKNLKIYRLADETDLLAGKIFRTTFKQQIVNEDPSFLRFMNYHGGNDTMVSRWESRTLPTNAGYSQFGNWVSSPPYGTTTGTNQYALAAVTTGSNQTPVASTHGEVVTARFGNGCVRAGTTGTAVSAIQNQNIPQVTMNAAVTFQAGDTIVIRQSGGSTISGMMTRLNYFPVTVNTVTDSTHFTINADTTTWGALTANGGSIVADAYISLNVGGRGDFPIMYLSGTTTACRFGNNYISAGDYKPMVFSKNIAAKSDGAGNYIYGVWMFYDLGTWGFPGEVPIEICTALVNEVNALAVSQGVNHPINMWANVPVLGLSSIDPDYTLASNYAVQMTSTILNGANGYSGLTANAKLVTEFSNETWNINGCTGFCQAFYLQWAGYLRWPSSGLSDITDMVALRSTAMARDIHANVASSRVYIVMGGHGFEGFAVNSSNRGRVYGNATAGQPGNYYTTDATVTGGGWGTPISNHDGFATASYFDPPSAYYSTTAGAGTFTDDSAMYNGLNNTGNGGGNYTGAANTAQAITNFVAQVVGNNTGCSSSNQSTSCYAQTIRPAYASGLPVGKPSIEYEGGTDWAVQAGQSMNGHTLTAGDQTFSTAVINSSQWSTAQLNYFNTAAAIPNTGPSSVYIWISGTSAPPPSDQHWGYASPDAYSSGIEGQALLNNPFWVGSGSRNQSLN